MTDCPETDVQILVHISAPSGAKDDARYRKQAHALLGFETAGGNIILRPEHEHVEPKLAAISARNTTDREKLEAERNEVQPASDQEYWGYAGPSRALTSPILSSSPHDRPQTAPSAATPPLIGTKFIRRTQSDSWGTPPSVVPDSQPLDPAETNAGTESPVRRRLSPQYPVEEPSAKRRRIETAAVLSPAKSSSSPLASPIGTHSNFASVASSRLLSALSPSYQLQSRPSRLSSSTTPTPQIHVSSSKQQEPPPQRPSCSPPLHSSSAHPSPIQHNQPAPPSSPNTQTVTLTIHPPPPPTTSKPFKTHLTASLALVAKHADLPKRYQPTLTARPLRPLERGHWLIDCTTFPPHLRTKMWEFLTDFVGQGRAGWGVWCEFSVSASGSGRPEAEAETQVTRVDQGLGGVMRLNRDVENDGGDERQSEEGGDGKDQANGNAKAILQIYCWGEVVPHIYIVLFLATSRMVKGAGASWIDGAGEVVVRMP